MSTFSYHKPGIGNTSSYLVSGLPFITCSIAPPLDETSAVVNFPRVTNYVVVKNTSETNVGLRVSFNNDSIVDNTRYVLLSKGESFSGELRTTDVHLMSDGAAPVPFTVIAGLTNIERGEMTQTVPKPPNLLAWVEKQKLLASDSEAGDRFGTSVSLSSDANTLVVGSLWEDPDGISNAGSVYVFTRSGSTWIEQQKLTASDKEESDVFGVSVSLSSDGNTLAVGALAEDPDGIDRAGSAYVFTRSGSTWTEEQKLTASDKQAIDYFGASVSLSSDGNTLAVAAYYEDPDGLGDAGSAYVFTRSGSTWTEEQKLTASDKGAGDNFGRSLSLSSDGSTIAIGVQYEDPDGIGNAGSTYVFTRSGSTWTEEQKLTASDKQATDYFGASVSLSSDGNTLAVGAWTEDPDGLDYAGSAYVFTRSGSTWTEEQKLTASDKQPQDSFGVSVSLGSDGNALVVGAGQEDPDGIDRAGSAYVFTRSGSTWTEKQKLTASDKGPNDLFGSPSYLNYEAGVLVLGASYRDIGDLSNIGGVYVFRYTRDY